MKEIKAEKITKVVIDLVKKANFSLRNDVLSVLRNAYRSESNKRAKKIIKAILDNAAYAKKNDIAICQDTGMPVVFVEVGTDVKIDGDLKTAINKGVAEGYKKYSLRNSIIKDPLLRENPGSFPSIIHTDIIGGNKIKITLLPKGFGCENKSQLKMFNPTAGIKEIINFVVGTVKSAGPDACPPYFVGVGIGGTADYSGILAKQALLTNMLKENSKLEEKVLREINKSNIGPMGLGGKTTALAVRIQKYPTHIAGLSVSVNISCHALRSAAKII